LNLKEIIGQDVNIPDEVWLRNVVRVPQSKLRQSIKVKEDDTMELDEEQRDAPFYSLARATLGEPLKLRKEFDAITSSKQVIGLLNTFYDGKLDESARYRSTSKDAAADPMTEDEFKPFPAVKSSATVQRLRFNPQKLLRRRKDPVQTTGASGSFARIAQMSHKGNKRT